MFDNVQLGDKFLTREGKKAIYIYTEGSSRYFIFEGYEKSGVIGVNLNGMYNNCENKCDIMKKL